MAGNGVQLSQAEILELIAQNAEMRRLLAEHQWSGLTPVRSSGVCPECCGSSRHGHRPGCALGAALDATNFA
ncbi:MAG TPA: hypothetical protein VGI87_14445 [Solirubrobacteraceae bacterium]|jgi:hypothetical protein